LGDSPYRFNWQTPILLSSHNQDILYYGGNKLMRSMNQGDDWTAISGDLTKGGKKGNVAFGTLTTIAESPSQFGLLYTGSDDGMVYVTKNGGGNWINISTGLPSDLWVSRVVASAHKKERVYVSLNGYRSDDFKTYVYLSDNYGATWKNIGTSIPIAPVNVIKEDTESKDILYVGTDNGLYISLDRGTTWEACSKGLPNVAIHDLVLQPEAKDLVVGTHGRSLYKANVAPIQGLKNAAGKALHVFDIESIRASGRWGSSWSKWLKPYEPEHDMTFYTKTAGTLTVAIMKGKTVLNTFTVKADKGLNYTKYDLTITEKGKKALEKTDDELEIEKKTNGKYYLPKGEYTVYFSMGETKEKKTLSLN
jgi:hypothetical protein